MGWLGEEPYPLSLLLSFAMTFEEPEGLPVMRLLGVDEGAERGDRGGRDITECGNIFRALYVCHKQTALLFG